MAMDTRRLGNRPPPEPDEEQDAPPGTVAGVGLNELEELTDFIRANEQAGCKLRLFRRGPLESGFSYVHECGLMEFDYAFVARQFGGGKYQARVLDSRGKYHKQFNFAIDDRLRGMLDSPAGTEKPAAPVTPAGSFDMPAMLKLMEMQQERSDRNMMLMLAMMQESAKTTMTVVTAALSGRRERSEAVVKSEPSSKILDSMMPLLLENMKAKGSESSLVKSLEDVKALKELFGSDEPKDDMFDKLLGVAAPMLGGLMQKAGAAATPVIRSVGPGSNGAGAPSGHPPAADPLIQQLRQALPILLNAARRDTDPQSYFDFVADNLSPEQLERLVSIARRPDWLTVLFDDDPRIAAHAEWFADLRTAFIGEPTAETADPPDGEPGGPAVPA